MKLIRPIFKYLFVLFVFGFLSASEQFAQDSSVLKSNVEAAAEYYGKLDTELTPDLHDPYGVIFKLVVDLAKYKFVRPLENEAVVSVGSLLDRRNKTAGGKSEILLVEPKNGNPYFYADLNLSGTFEEAERFLPASSKESANDYDLLLKLPVNHPFYQSFPVFLRFKRGFKHPNLKAGERLVFQSYSAFAGGAVSINNKTVRVRYPFDPAEPSISTTDGLFGIDTNGDGLIRDEPFSPETSYATKDEIVFRFGEMYLSTRSIDLAVNKITMRVRQKSEYLREELETGREMTDFSFVDFDNKKRTLKEFRGKYLLIDFWGMWCVDCRRELPFQIEAEKRFGKRKFAILSLGSDESEKFAEVKAFLAKNKITWTQARYESIKPLIETSYRIQEYPSAILLDPNGKVITLKQEQLKGAQLLETLDRILPQ